MTILHNKHKKFKDLLAHLAEIIQIEVFIIKEMLYKVFSIFGLWQRGTVAFCINSKQITRAVKRLVSLS